MKIKQFASATVAMFGGLVLAGAVMAGANDSANFDDIDVAMYDAAYEGLLGSQEPVNVSERVFRNSLEASSAAAQPAEIEDCNG